MKPVDKKVNVKDWKFWILMVVPISFIVVGIALGIILLATKNYNLPLIILTFVLTIVSITISSIASLIKGIKSGNGRKLAASIISSVVFIAFVVVLLVSLLQLPQIFAMEKETDELWQQYIDTDSQNKELAKSRRDAYLESKSNLRDVSRPTKLAMQICLVAGAVIQLLCGWIAGDFDRTDKPQDDNNQDNTSENEQQ